MIRVRVYGNSSWNFAQFNGTTLQYQIDGGGFSNSAPMHFAGGRLFRGEIPGTVTGTIDYRVAASDEHGNTGTSTTKTFTSNNGCTGSISTRRSGRAFLPRLGSPVPYSGNALSQLHAGAG